MQTAGIDNRHAPGGTAEPRRIARALRSSYGADLGPTAAFLPDRVPLDHLGGVFEPFLAAATELPARFPAGLGGVRGWLSRTLPTADPQVTRAIAGLGRAERETLMTVLSMLGHAFRWDHVPPAAERFAEQRIPLPEGLAHPWAQLASIMDQPPVGTTWSLHLCNWTIDGRPGGAAYRPDELTADNVHVAWNWLLPPVDRHLDRFSVSFVLLEATGAPVLACLVAGVEAAADHRDDDLATALDQLQAAIDAMIVVFSLTVRRQTIDPDLWLSLVQPTFAWSAEAGTPGRIEGGPSGMQVGSVQSLDAALGVGGTSTIAKAAAAGRRLMPARHRRFLGLLDLAGPVLRDRVREANRCDVTEHYNRCLRSLARFRATHHSRGATYLNGRPADGARRVSTGLTIGADDDATEVFRTTMTERVAETRAALLPPAT